MTAQPRIRIAVTNEECAQYIPQARALVQKLLRTGQANATLAFEDAVIIATKAPPRATIIWLGGGSFICNPADDASPGGYTAGGVPLPSRVYPLVDDDGGSVTVDADNSVARDMENYGNLDWKGDAGVLTFKGPPSRHFPLPDTANIPGFTVFDETVTITVDGLPQDVDYYTPFSPNVYQEGAVRATLPTIGTTTPKVLGAAIASGVLVVMAGTNYRGAANPDGGIGGFYYELWAKAENWERWGWASAPRQKVPWFFSAKGLRAASLVGEIIYRCTVDTTAKTATFTLQDGVCSGVRTTTRNSTSSHTPADNPVGVWQSLPAGSGDGPWIDTTTSELIRTVTRSQDCIVAVDFVGEEEVYARTILTGTTTSSQNTEKKSVYGAVPDVPYDPPQPLGAVTGPDAWTGHTSDYSVSGGCAPVYFTTVPVPGSCGMQPLTATDAKGNTSTKMVRMSSGRWGAQVPTGSTFSPSYMTSYIEGDTQYNVGIQQFWVSSCGVCSSPENIPQVGSGCRYDSYGGYDYSGYWQHYLCTRASVMSTQKWIC